MRRKDGIPMNGIDSHAESHLFATALAAHAEAAGIRRISFSRDQILPAAPSTSVEVPESFDCFSETVIVRKSK